MPNIGFFELVLISIVALLVLGPDKLPGAIRTTSLWVGRARRSFNKVKADIERELNTDEIRRQLHNESILADIEEAKQKARALAEETRQDLERLGEEVDHGVKDLTSLREQAETNPALLDEAPVPDAAETAVSKQTAAEQPALEPQAAAPETHDTPRKPAPPQDFYNNPDVGVVQLRDGKFQPADTHEHRGDEERDNDGAGKQ